MKDTRTLGNLVSTGARVRVRCLRSHVGLKSARPCRPPDRFLDLATLAAVFGPMSEVWTLREHMFCPGCGSRQIDIEVIASASPVDQRETLANTTTERFHFTCISCGRRGRHRRASLIDAFGRDQELAGLPKLLAARRRCPYALDGDGSACGARYDLAAIYREQQDG